MVIGNYIADLIDDGSTIQLGIGDIPNAVASALKDKHDLGVHTEMLNNAMIGLYKAGVITNHKKTLYRDRIVTTFSLGSKESYDFIDNNVGVLHLDVIKTNDPYVIAQNDNMPMTMRRTDINALLSDYCAEKEAEAEEWGFGFHYVNDSHASPVCLTDEGQLRRVFDNIVENSRKYCGSNDPSIEVSLSDGGNGGAVIAFRDNGNGPGAEKITHIFERFYRGDESRNTEGSGLGLYLCSQIIEQHRGTIEAGAENGFTVTIRLPAAGNGEDNKENIEGEEKKNGEDTDS